jgi:hypothetical protein
VDGDIDWDDPEASISVWVKFESTSRQKPIYFVSLYGHATHFAEKEKVLFH